MAVLLAKTMGQLNEEHKTVYPLFQKPSKAIKPETIPAPSIQQSFDGPSDEAVPKNATVRGSKNPKKSVKDDSDPQPTLKASVITPPQIKPDLLEEVDPNKDRRKRQKKAATDGGTSPKTEDVPPRSLVRESAQRRHEAPILPIPVESELENISKGTTASTIETEAGKASDIPKRSQESTIQTQVESGTLSPHGLFGRDKPINTASTTVVQDGIESTKITTNQPVDSKPKKVLHFNPKTGTIGSPPAKKAVSSIEAANKPRSSSRAKQPKSKLVIIRYGHGEASASPIGLQIDQILKGTKRIEPLPKKDDPSPKKKGPLTSKATEVSKIDAPESKSTKAVPITPKMHPAPLHPFFSGKPVVKPSPKKITKPAALLTDLELEEPTGLGKARRELRSKPPTPTKPRSSAFAGFLGFGTSAKIVKFPGATEPALPWKGMVHIRGNENLQDDELGPIEAPLETRSKNKKSKYHAIEILAEEDVLVTITADLVIDQILKGIQDIKLDEYPQLPGCLRVPRKHFESGYKLQKRIRNELHVRVPPPVITNDEESSEDEIQERGSIRASPHPALSKAYASIATSLTAFDEFRYETQQWTHKYSPTCAAEVLQTGRESVILNEWLQKLTVLSVETGASDRPSSRASSVSRRPATSKSEPNGKRKRKPKKLDGFVVSSDEEGNDMDEISEPEDDPSPRGGQGLLKKTVIRQGDAAAKGSKDAPRLTNAIVISGPHGCGKTAAVYAVAKELGFEVFEINSSSRRSGKDILEKVGDMTRNHLVQRSHDPAPLEPRDEDAERISDALADDIKSGRQGTMNSFFKPEDAPKPTSKPKKSQSTAKTSKDVQTSLVPKAPPKQQKQSLILFEEVDVLYEEDKQFWATVMTLVSQSKRPIIMTCQDESAVPLHTLSLHAILRFTPAPVDLATDYMLLVAANEGHALKRDAVKALYQSRHLDLRASLAELNFWCQFAVGDVKGGLDWLCPRWPLGCDVDDNGSIIRVVSENTYEAGMGWLSQDFLEGHMRYLDIEEETLHEAWDGWSLDLGHWQKSIDMTGWADKTQNLSGGKADDRACLSIYDDFADAMSIADLCSGSAFAVGNQIQLDFTIPELSDKVREDYLCDHPILEATPLVDFDNTGLDIALWMKSRTRKYLQVDQHVKHGFEIPSELDRPSEAHIVDLIENHISSPQPVLTRHDLSLAFDPISEPEKLYAWSSDKLEVSVFDRTQTIITTDLAPYVRSIVSYDAKLQQERSRMSNLLSEGGKKPKRMRTTRSAFSALEGGARSTTRRDRYFGEKLNPYLVFKTGLPSWLAAVPSGSAGTTASTRLSTEDSDLSRVESEGGEDELGNNSL